MYNLTNEELAKIVENVYKRCFSDFYGGVKNVEIKRSSHRLISAYCDNMLLCPIDLERDEIRMFIQRPKMIRVVTRGEIDEILACSKV